MRAHEFLFTESKVVNSYFSTASSSHKKYMSKIQTSIINGGPLHVHVGGEIIDIYFATEYQKRVAKKAIKDHINAVTDASKKGQKAPKAPFVKAVAADGESIKFQIDKIEKRFDIDGVTQITVNAGNVTEGVLGFSLAAKFQDSNSEITEEHVLKVGEEFFKTSEGVVRLNVVDRTSDELQLKITLPSGDMMALEKLIEYKGDADMVGDKLGLSAAAKKKLQKLIPNTIQYANNGVQPNAAVDKIRSYYTDDIKQTISVISDGAESENQSITKVDLSISAIDGTGKEEVMALLSIKSGTGAGKGSGSTQIGQAGGRAYKNLAKFWRQAFAYELPKKYKSHFEKFVVPKPITKENIRAVLFGPIKETYTWAKTQIDKHLKGDNTMGELQFLEHMQRGLLYHSAKHASLDDPASKTKGIEDIVVVYMNPDGVNAFIELNFGSTFKQVLQYFDLKPELKETGSEIIIKIFAVPSANMEEAPPAVQDIVKDLYTGANDFLVSYRSHADGKNIIRNTVNLGTQSKSLANLANLTKFQLQPINPRADYYNQPE